MGKSAFPFRLEKQTWEVDWTVTKILLVNESITRSLASLCPFLVLVAVQRIHPNLSVLLWICLAFSNRRGRRVLILEEAQLSKSYLNIHFQSSQGLLHVPFRLCSSVHPTLQYAIFFSVSCFWLLVNFLPSEIASRIHPWKAAIHAIHIHSCISAVIHLTLPRSMSFWKGSSINQFFQINFDLQSCPPACPLFFPVWCNLWI